MYKAVRRIGTKLMSSFAKPPIAVEYQVGKRVSSRYGPLMVFDDLDAAEICAKTIVMLEHKSAAVFECDIDPYLRRAERMMYPGDIKHPDQVSEFWRTAPTRSNSGPLPKHAVLASSVTLKNPVMELRWVYKLVRLRHDNSLTSLTATEWAKDYTQFKRTTPDIGLLMAFDNIELARLHAKDWKDFSGEDVYLFKCVASVTDGPGKLPRYTLPQDIVKFWSMPDLVLSRDPPQGTVFCKWVIPISQGELCIK